MLSRTDNKRDDAMLIGADAYYATSSHDTFVSLANTFDLIINTVSGSIDVDAHLSLLALGGAVGVGGCGGDQLVEHLRHVGLFTRGEGAAESALRVPGQGVELFGACHGCGLSFLAWRRITTRDFNHFDTYFVEVVTELRSVSYGHALARFFECDVVEAGVSCEELYGSGEYCEFMAADDFGCRDVGGESVDVVGGVGA